MRLIRQPEGSSLCGQACCAMAAGVSLDRAIEAVGHSKVRGTHTHEVVRALHSLGIDCATRLRRVSRVRPALPKRCIVAISSDHTPRRWHWILCWDGQMLDPAGRWPDFDGWRITSYLELFT